MTGPNSRESASSTGHLTRLKFPALGLVFLLLVVTVVASFLDISIISEPPFLAFAMNIITVFVSSSIIAVIAARSFVTTGNWPVAWFGGGALIFGLTMIISGWLAGATVFSNVSVTMHNTGAVFAATFHFLGAFFALNRIPPRESGPGRLAVIVWLYGIAMAVIFFVTMVSVERLLPVFFLQSFGGTPIRQMILGVAAALFLAAGIIYFRQYRHTGSDLLYWYSLGLMLLAIGMAGIMMQTAMGTFINWVARSAQWSSGLYLLAAALITMSESRAKHISAGEAIADLLSQTEARLRETEERFRMVFEHAKLGIMVKDMEQMIVENNTALEDMLGYSKEELRREKFTARIHPDDVDVGHPLINEVIAGTQDHYQVEKRLFRKEGKIIWARLTGSLIKVGGKPLLMVLVDDITERKEIERLKDDFLGMVSHELKNPLTVVLGSLQIATRSMLPPEDMRELISSATESAEALSVILENMLELSRVQAGRFTLLQERADLPALINSAMESVKRKNLLHHLVVDIPEGLPQPIIDQTRIGLVLRNFLDNAIKYSPGGGDVIVFVRREPGDLVIGVRDQGIGIPQSQLRDLFQPFERLGMTGIKGTGLGLIVCRRLVEAHRGRVWVESEEGKGSTFYFSLPVPPGEAGD